MKNFLILLVLLFICGCAHVEPSEYTNDPTYRAILGCTAGILSGSDYSAGFEAELSKAVKNKNLDLKSTANVNNFVHGYIFENLPESDRLKAYEAYLNCFNEQMNSQSSTNITSQTMINSPGGSQIAVDSLTINQESPNKYKPFDTSKRLELINKLIPIQKICSDRQIKIEIFYETGNTGRQRVGKDLYAILKEANFEMNTLHTGMYASSRVRSAIEINYNSEDLDIIRSLAETLNSYIHVTFQANKRKDPIVGHIQICIYGEPIFAEDGSISFL